MMPDSVSAKYQHYWQLNIRLTSWMLILWLLLTFGATYFADVLNQFTFLGFPLGYYMAAQGILVLYLAIVWFYARYMNRLDEAYEVDEDD